MEIDHDRSHVEDSVIAYRPFKSKIPQKDFRFTICILLQLKVLYTTEFVFSLKEYVQVFSRI
jgi:hypothetical protein